MGRPTTLQQRLEIMRRAEQGASDQTIGSELGLSRWTVRKWRRQGQQHGRAGLASQMGRPARGALSSFASEIATWVKQQREAHPGWGPQTLRDEMQRAVSLKGLPLPGRTQIATYLQEQGLSRKYERRTTLRQPTEPPGAGPHEEWQMDAQGVQSVGSVEQVVVINILDPYSHLKVDSCACGKTSKALTEDYQLACRRAFLRFGRPKQLSLDHDTVFWDSHCASPYPTRLHLWLIALDIAVRFIQRPPPQEHSDIERMHQTMTQQALAGQALGDTQAIQHSLDTRRYVLNQQVLTTAAGSQPSPRHSGRAYTPETEGDLLDLNRVYAYLAQHSWFRRVSRAGQFSLGGYRYGLGLHVAQQEIEIACDPATQQLICSAADGHELARLDPQGLTKAALMGEAAPWQRLPAYQRRLPLCPGACREALFFQAM